jgi:flavin reductase (DIM6/NTAB) family NADH-FMN oxidoreductase RutF
MDAMHDMALAAAMQADFKKGMRRLSSSVAIITAGGPRGRNGMTATAVCSVSADPPILLVGINRGASIHDQVVETGAFGVNILRTRHTRLAERFSSGLPGETRFEQGRWRQAALGVPVLEDALASFVCETIKLVTVATHDIFFGQVVGIDVGDGTPLLYGGGQYEISLPATPLAYHATL